MTCERCIYKTTRIITKTKSGYNGLSGSWESLPYTVKVPACAKDSGMPVEIPKDRPRCQHYAVSYPKEKEEARTSSPFPIFSVSSPK